MNKINWKNSRNLTLLADFYELTMANGYLNNGMKDWVAGFDVFYRKNPDNGGFSIMGGLHEVIDYISNIRFEEDELNYLSNLKIFSDEFIDYLKDFKFTGNIYAVPDGTVIFPTIPIMKVVAPIIEAQFVETTILASINGGCLFTTKASRMIRSLPENAIALEFGARRVQGFDVAVNAPRYAYIAGFHGTSSTIAGYTHGIPVSGTMAHSWIMSFDTELEAFETYCRQYPDSSVLLVDTYDTLRSGVPNAIKAFDNVLKNTGHRPKGIRLDSGNLSDLSIRARKMLDDAGYPDCMIYASNSLDEETITSLTMQGAKIDGFGIGERFVTAKSEPVFGAVYKLAFITKPDGTFIPKMKFSENVAKTTNPSSKKVFRFYDKETGMALVDVIALEPETVDTKKPYIVFDPIEPYKKMKLENYEVKELLVPIFVKGELVYVEPTLDEQRMYCKKQLDTIYPDVKRLLNPHKYYVDLSQQLYDKKLELILKRRKELGEIV